MKILQNESLGKYTTIRIGGVAENFIIPESKEELIEAIKKYPGSRILSAGSNLLINDKLTFSHIIYMKDADKSITHLGDGRFYVGASVRCAVLINEINRLGYGGIEEMISIPGFLGGLIYMNASIGKDEIALSTYINKVYAVKDGVELELSHDECKFEHRSSIFQSGEYVIVGAELTFPEQNSAISEARKKARLVKCKENLDFSGHNFGSVFKTCDYKLMDRLRRLHIKCGNASLSDKTTNWILADKDAKFKDVYRVIQICILFHKVFLKKAEPEVCIWK